MGNMPKICKLLVIPVWTIPKSKKCTFWSVYCRPLSHTRLKDSKIMMMKWAIDHELEIEQLLEHLVIIDDTNIFVKYKVYPSLLDGKMRTAVLSAVLEEANRQGYNFKCHGHAKKLDNRTCWVSPQFFNKEETNRQKKTNPI